MARQEALAGGLRHCFRVVACQVDHRQVDHRQPLAAAGRRPHRVGELRQAAVAGDQHADAGVRDHEGEAVERVRRVERHVGAAGLDDGEQHRHQLRAAVERDADLDAGSDAARRQHPGQAAGAARQLAVGHRRRRAVVAGRGEVEQRRALRLPRRHRREDRGQRLLRRPVGTAGQLAQQLLALVRGEPGQRPDGRFRRRRRRRQQALEVAEHALQRGVVEEVAGELHRQLELAVVALHRHQREVELGHPGGAVDAAHGEPGAEVAHRARRVLQHEQHLHQRLVRQRALRRHVLHQALEGQLLVLLGLQPLGQHAAQQLGERRPGGARTADVRAVHQGVDEEADQRLDLHPRAAGDRRADRHLRLPGPARQQRLEAGHQDHEQGGAVGLAEAAQVAGERGGEAAAGDAAAVARHRRPRPVGGQLEDRRQAGQAPAPPGDLGVQGGAGEPGVLPAREVGVLDRAGAAAPAPGRRRWRGRAPPPRAPARPPTSRRRRCGGARRGAGAPPRRRRRGPASPGGRAASDRATGRTGCAPRRVPGASPRTAARRPAGPPGRPPAARTAPPAAPPAAARRRRRGRCCAAPRGAP